MVSLSNVQFVIFGIISDPRKYQHSFSLQDFVKSHTDYAKKTSRECIEKKELQLLLKGSGLNSRKIKSKLVSETYGEGVKRKDMKSRGKKIIKLSSRQIQNIRVNMDELIEMVNYKLKT